MTRDVMTYTIQVTGIPEEFLERLEALLLDGLESGEPTPMTKEDWEAIRREGRARLQARKPNGAGG